MVAVNPTGQTIGDWAQISMQVRMSPTALTPATAARMARQANWIGIMIPTKIWWCEVRKVTMPGLRRVQTKCSFL
ncbi:hypothetical protein BDR03DRAFT_949672, partial [Suillus americanus]